MLRVFWLNYDHEFIELSFNAAVMAKYMTLNRILDSFVSDNVGSVKGSGQSLHDNKIF